AERVHVLTADTEALGHVLGGHAHRDVDEREAAVAAEELRVEPARPETPAPATAATTSTAATTVALLAFGCGRPRALLDAAGDVDVALAGGDGMGGAPDRLQARRAEAVDGEAGHGEREAGQDAGGAGDAEAGLTGLRDVAADDVDDVRLLDLGDLGHECVEDEGHELVGSHV